MAKAVKNGTYHHYPLRMEQSMLDRAKVLVESETKRIGRPQPLASILRQALALGLEKLEKGTGK